MTHNLFLSLEDPFILYARDNSLFRITSLKFLKWTFFSALASGLLGLAFVIGLYFYLSPGLPDVNSLKEIKLQTPLKVFTQDGKLISQYGEKRRIPLTIEQIPLQMQQAFLAIEDSRFYQHPGIDPIGITRAAINLIVTGEKRQGASTITQQVARNYFLTREKTFIRKIKEVFLAWKIEQSLSKDEILLLYLNKIPLGHRSFGVGAAAQVYYGKDVSELTLAQVAVIAGLPKAPSTLNPIRSPERSRARRNLVLMRMLDLKFITPEQYNIAKNAPTTGKRHGAQIELDAPYLGEMVRSYMVDKYGREAAYSKGFNVYTTVPSHLQIAAQQAVAGNIHAYDLRHGYRGPEAILWQSNSVDALSQTGDSLPISDLEVDDKVWSEQEIIAQLAKEKSFKTLLPAVVTGVAEQSFSALLASGETIIVKWDQMKWAREFIDDDRQGSAPKLASEIVSPGQLIRVVQQDELWRISQIPEVSGAFVALDPNDGALKSIVGGYNFAKSQFNRVTQAKRQIGSNIKPFVYSNAMDNNFTLASILNDVPITKWDRSQGAAWRPKNSPPIYNGLTRLRLGLAQSKNVMSVKLIQQLGIRSTINHLTRFGFEKDDLPFGESLALGSASVTPLSVAVGYSAFANGGYLIEPYFIERIENQNDGSIFNMQPLVACDLCQQPMPQPIILGEDGTLATSELSAQCVLPKDRLAPRIISPQNAFLVRQMMRSVITGGGSWNKGTGWAGTAWRVRNTIKRKDVGGKTGTTNDSKDTWFSGITPHLVATSWVGFDSPSRALGSTRKNKNFPKDYPQIKGGESGAKTALPAWIKYMEVALNDYPEQPLEVPPGITTVRIDRATGLLANRFDHTSLFEYFATGTQPTKYVEQPQLTIDGKKDEPSDDLFDGDIF